MPIDPLTVTKRRARHGTNEHSRAAEAIPGAGTERPGRHVVDQIAGDAFTERGGQPGADHGPDRADQAASGRGRFRKRKKSYVKPIVMAVAA